MSFILDALKKSEAERQRQAGPALLEMRIAPPARGLPAWAIAVGLVLLAGVGVLGWLALRTKAAPAQTVAHAGMPTAAARETAGTPPASNAAWPAPGALPAAGAGATPIGGVGNGSTGVTQVAPLESAAQSGDTTGADRASDNPADNAPAVAADPRNAAAGTGVNGAKLRNYAELNGSVPELRLDLHVYAPNPADRYAFINMHKVREGDVTPEGAEVRQITRDGVVLEYRGSEFLLGRQ